MNHPSANLMVAIFDSVVCIKISGRATFVSSVDLNKLVEELANRGQKHFVFDLTDCVMMDSTFLGVLAGIALKLRSKKETTNCEPQLLNANARISEVLENLGMAHLFKLVNSKGQLTNAYEPAKSENVSQVEITRTCLEAHKLLMSIQPENVSKFKDVAQFLAEDLKRQETSGKT
ncbi:MAG: STAS domain-containing protein [Limisphaerales bacterium]